MKTPDPSTEPTPTQEIHPWTTISSPPRAWLQVLATAAGMFLGAIFLVAAWAKILDPAAFVAQIELEGLDFLLPASAVAYIALALEVFLGAALFFWVRRTYILWPTAALVVFFLFLTGRTYWHDLQGTLAENAAGCGCFGNLVERTPAEAFWQDLVLMVPALLLAFLVLKVDPAWPFSEQSPKVRLGAVGVLTLAALLVAWKAPELPLDNLATRLKPGVEVAALCAGNEDEGKRVCLNDVVLDLTEGEYIVVLADLEDADFGKNVGWLNEYHWSLTGSTSTEPTSTESTDAKPRLAVMTSASEEQSFTFRFTYGPAFETHEAPQTLLKPLYRTLPRSFLTRQGKVVETFSGLPPLERWGAPPKTE